MKDVGRIIGNEEQAKPLIIGKNTVYVHSNITPIESSDECPNLYEYDEIQYDKDEYIKIMSEQNNDLAQQITDTQLALCDVYELLS